MDRSYRWKQKKGQLRKRAGKGKKIGGKEEERPLEL